MDWEKACLGGTTLGRMGRSSQTRGQSGAGLAEKAGETLRAFPGLPDGQR